MSTMKEPLVTSTHHAPEFKHPDDMEWEMGRFKNVTKFLFHPRPERPTEPNLGFLRYKPGAGFPLHKHDFAQVWYIINGEFKINGKVYGPSTLASCPIPILNTKCIPTLAVPCCSFNILARQPVRSLFTTVG